MSFKLTREAWQTPLDGNPKYVLLALADYADKRGVCFPGIDKISIKCGLNERTVRRAVKILLKEGYIMKWRRFNTSNIYQLSLSSTGQIVRSIKDTKSDVLRTNCPKRKDTKST